jgi:hypothetical protein
MGMTSNLTSRLCLGSIADDLILQKRCEGVWRPSFQSEDSSGFAFEGELQFWNLCGLRHASPTGTTVVLKSAKYPNKEPIAYALFMSCDPNAQVGGVALGKLFWKVCITHPMEENEELVRPWSSLKTLRDAKGKTISWPSVLVCFFLTWFSLSKHISFIISMTCHTSYLYIPQKLSFFMLKRLMVKIFSWVYSSSRHHQNKGKSSMKISCSSYIL